MKDGVCVQGLWMWMGWVRELFFWGGFGLVWAMRCRDGFVLRGIDGLRRELHDILRSAGVKPAWRNPFLSGILDRYYTLVGRRSMTKISRYC
jgi:hypothetical protein